MCVTSPQLNHCWYFLVFVSDRRHFRVSSMLGKDSVKSRLDSGSGLSFTEFSYQLFQANDFLRLFQDYNCVMQVRSHQARLSTQIRTRAFTHTRFCCDDGIPEHVPAGWWSRPVGKHHSRAGDDSQGGWGGTTGLLSLGAAFCRLISCSYHIPRMPWE